MYVFRISSPKKLLIPTSQSHGSHAVYCLRWLVKRFFLENFLLHSSHVCGFSPVWTKLCLFRSPLVENLLSHKSQFTGFSAEWSSYVFSELLFLETFYHTYYNETVSLQFQMDLLNKRFSTNFTFEWFLFNNRINDLNINANTTDNIFIKIFIILLNFLFILISVSSQMSF